MTDTVYFVDDNFIGNRKAALDLLPHLVEWQKKTGYVMRLACEATLNIAKRPEILEKMREAYFITIFCGIETPDPDALRAMHKDHNMMVPILEGVRTINSYGMEVVSGIIMGLDTDKPGTADALVSFIDESQIPLLTINLLQALPKTPLWDRLEREKRLILDDDGRDSNVDFLLPYDDVVAAWKKCMAAAYQPEKLYARYQYQCDYTSNNRLKVPVAGARRRRAGPRAACRVPSCAAISGRRPPAPPPRRPPAPRPHPPTPSPARPALRRTEQQPPRRARKQLKGEHAFNDLPHPK